MEGHVWPVMLTNHFNIIKIIHVSDMRMRYGNRFAKIGQPELQLGKEQFLSQISKQQGNSMYFVLH